MHTDRHALAFMSQHITVTCRFSPSIRFRWERVFSVMPEGRYFWIFCSFSSNKNSLWHVTNRL